MTQSMGNELMKEMPYYKTLKDFSLILKLYPLGSFTPEFMHVFEEYLSDFLIKNEKHISLEDLTYLLNLLALTKKRPVKILRTLSSILMISLDKDPTLLDPEYIATTVYSLNKLSYNDVDLYTKICDSLVELDPPVMMTIKRNTLVSLLTSLGQGRFLHQPLLDNLVSSVKDTMASRRPLSSSELACILITLAKLGYRPSALNDISRDFIIPNVTREQTSSDGVWIDYLWSLAFFNLVDKNHPLMKQVLDPSSLLVQSIQDKIRDGEVSCRTDLSKIFNIQAFYGSLQSSQKKRKSKSKTKEEVSDCLLEPPSRSQDCISFCKSVTDHLNYFVPKGSHMELGVKTNMGFNIDARFVISSDLKALSLEKVSSIPQGYHRINVLTASFRQTLLNHPTRPTGQVKMAAQLIKEVLGETVVVVTPTPFFSKNDSVQKVSFLQTLIKDAIYQV